MHRVLITCCFCACACNLYLEVDGGKIVGVIPDGRGTQDSIHNYIYVEILRNLERIGDHADNILDKIKT